MSAFRKSSNILFLLMIILTGLNLLQAFFTELIMDEAYYWYFAQDLSWGYFDHPPMVALLVHLGGLMAPAEAGVRLFAPFMYTAGLLLLWDLTDHPLKKNHPWLFFWLTGGLALLAAYGFFMLPDTPLFLFSVLFLKSYKEYLKKPGILPVLALSICMAAIMYSKYQGALFILFVILSKPANLKDLRIWASIVIGVILYLPHLLWLYQNDFVSVMYHLVERANSAYSPKFTWHFLINALALGGLAFPLFYYAVLKAKTKNDLDRALKTIFYGFLIFFFISSFNRKTQIQWINLINIPFIIFGFRYALNHLQFRKWIYRLSAAATCILIYARLALVFPALSPIPYESHGNREWAAELYNKSNGLPVVFHNSYRDAATYAFYSGARVHSMNDVGFRRNQFDIDHSEEELRDKPVIILSQREVPGASFSYTRPFKEKTWYGIEVDSFNNYTKMRFQVAPGQFKGGFPKAIVAEVYNPYQEQIPLKKLRIEGVTYDDNRKIIDTFALKAEDPELILPSGAQIELQLWVSGNISEQHPSYFQIGLGHYSFRPGFEGKMVNVTQVERDP